MIPIEQYAELCALMADTAGDEAKEVAIAQAHGVSGADWLASKAAWTAKMSDPADQGRTALAFMPIYQAAQARARGGKEPCTLEVYTRIHAEMMLRKDPLGNKIDYNLVLAEHGFTHQGWLECEGYWTPIVGADTILGQPNPRFDPQLAHTFRVRMQAESDDILGIVREAPSQPVSPQPVSPQPVSPQRASPPPVNAPPPVASAPRPPTPAEATKAALAEGAKGAVQGALMNRVYRFARQKLPRPLYRLIFSGKSAGELAEEEVRRRIRNLLWGCGCSVLFGGLFAGVLLLVLIIVGWAVVVG
jgi:hypothetical protein